MISSNELKAIAARFRLKRAPDLARWNELAAFLWARFSSRGSAVSPGAAAGSPDVSARPEADHNFKNIHHYYLPVFFWCLERSWQSLQSGSRQPGIRLHKDVAPVTAPILIGINGPQGCGKSRLSDTLVSLCEKEGLKAAGLSIDDFYLTRAEQVALAAAHPNNTYLQQRGYPGTHDVALGARILGELKKLAGSNAAADSAREVLCPVYDKSAHQGNGDRKPREEWKCVTGPLRFVFFDGWMLGYEPVASAGDPALLEVNERLRGYDSWTALLDAFIQLRPFDYRDVIAWRIEAEEKMKAAGKPGMTREQVENYVRKFVPAYETFLPGLSRKMEDAIAAGDAAKLTVTIGRDRLPTS